MLVGLVHSILHFTERRAGRAGSHRILLLQRWFLREKVGGCGLIALLRRIKKGFWYFVTFHDLHCLFFKPVSLPFTSSTAEKLIAWNYLDWILPGKDMGQDGVPQKDSQPLWELLTEHILSSLLPGSQISTFLLNRL